MKELNVLHLELFKGVNLLFRSQELLKLPPLAIKLFTVLAESARFVHFPRTSFLFCCCLSLGLSLSLHFNYFARKTKKEKFKPGILMTC